MELREEFTAPVCHSEERSDEESAFCRKKQKAQPEPRLYFLSIFRLANLMGALDTFWKFISGVE
jgi:hypothetical protein